METMADFGVVHYLGIESLSVGIYKSWFGLGDFSSAARLASILFILSFLVLSMESLFRKNESKYFSFDISTKETKIFSINPVTPFVIIFILVLLTLIIPVFWLIYNSISLLLENILILTHFIKASINSILLAFFGGALLTSFAAIICLPKEYMVDL